MKSPIRSPCLVVWSVTCSLLLLGLVAGSPVPAAQVSTGEQSVPVMEQPTPAVAAAAAAKAPLSPSYLDGSLPEQGPPAGLLPPPSSSASAQLQPGQVSQGKPTKQVNKQFVQEVLRQFFFELKRRPALVAQILQSQFAAPWSDVALNSDVPEVEDEEYVVAVPNKWLEMQPFYPSHRGDEPLPPLLPPQAPSEDLATLPQQQQQQQHQQLGAEKRQDPAPNKEGVPVETVDTPEELSNANTAGTDPQPQQQEQQEQQEQLRQTQQLQQVQQALEKVPSTKVAPPEALQAQLKPMPMGPRPLFLYPGLSQDQQGEVPASNDVYELESPSYFYYFYYDDAEKSNELPAPAQSEDKVTGLVEGNTAEKTDGNDKVTKENDIMALPGSHDTDTKSQQDEVDLNQLRND